MQSKGPKVYVSDMSIATKFMYVDAYSMPKQSLNLNVFIYTEENASILPFIEN